MPLWVQLLIMDLSKARGKGPAFPNQTSSPKSRKLFTVCQSSLSANALRICTLFSQVDLWKSTIRFAPFRLAMFIIQVVRPATFARLHQVTVGAFKTRFSVVQDGSQGRAPKGAHRTPLQGGSCILLLLICAISFRKASGTFQMLG